MERLSSGTVSLLVCSDAMARGIDVPGVDVVINYEAPTMIKTYVHRAGRTARAGRAGKCYTMLTSDQVQGFKALLRLADNNIHTYIHIYIQYTDIYTYIHIYRCRGSRRCCGWRTTTMCAV